MPIQPGETYTFAIPEGWQQGWREFKVRSNEPDPRKAAIEFIQLSFGDGTGFDGGGEAYPYKKKQSSTGPWFRYRAKVKDAQGAQVGRWAWDVFLVKAP